MAVTKKTFIDPPVLRKWLALVLFIVDIFVPGGRATEHKKQNVDVRISVVRPSRRLLCRLFSCSLLSSRCCGYAAGVLCFKRNYYHTGFVTVRVFLIVRCGSVRFTLPAGSRCDTYNMHQVFIFRKMMSMIGENYGVSHLIHTLLLRVLCVRCGFS